ncbi:MAG: family 43 glycosylhydrolase [Polyangia bacterium]
MRPLLPVGLRPCPGLALLAATLLAGACGSPSGGHSPPGTGGTSAPAGAGGATGGHPAGGAGTGGRDATGGAAGAPQGSGGVTSTGGVAGAGGAAGAGAHSGTAGAGGTRAAGGAGGTAGHDPKDGGADALSLPGTHNPVLPGLTADPHIAEFDGVFYIYPTTDGFANWGATSFSVFSSTNLVDWTSRGVILDLPKDLTWATDRAWAPAIARVGATYYFYFCAAQQIGVATSASPAGPFKDALGHPLIRTNEFGPQSIDPFFFLDDDGSRYLYFGSGTGGLRIVKLGADMISLSGTPANISPTGASGVLEGSAMFKRNGTYYLQWSEGDTRNASYQVAYARASSATGPFTRIGPILQQDPTQGILSTGGSTVLAFPARDAYYLAYHRFKIPGGDGTHREVCIDRMSFNTDGTIVPVKPTLKGLQTAVDP